jgi:hypothetical protein
VCGDDADPVADLELRRARHALEPAREARAAGGSTTSATSASRQSLMNSAVIAAGSSTELVTSVGRPCESTSEIASTSLVSRAMIQPARCSEK